MNYIINPSWFYWIKVADGVKDVSFVLAVAFGITSVAFTIWYIATKIEDATALSFGRDDEYTSVKERKLAKPYLIAAWIAFAVFTVVCLFVPSKNTLIEMMIAKQATYEHAQWTLETLKSAVDYIVNAMKQLK